MHPLPGPSRDAFMSALSLSGDARAAAGAYAPMLQSLNEVNLIGAIEQRQAEGDQLRAEVRKRPAEGKQLRADPERREVELEWMRSVLNAVYNSRSCGFTGPFRGFRLSFHRRWSRTRNWQKEQGNVRNTRNGTTFIGTPERDNQL